MAEVALAAAVPCEWCVAVIDHLAVPCEWCVSYFKIGRVWRGRVI